MSQLSNRISNFWGTIQGSLFPCLEEELLPLTNQHRQLVAILELIRIEDFIFTDFQWMGRPLASRKAMARAFIAKCVNNLPTTRKLYQDLQVDVNLRRICGWESRKDIPSESTLSRAFKEFSEKGVPQKAHEALIKTSYKEELVGHISRDSTAIEGREKPQYHRKLKNNHEEPSPKKTKGGRPKKGEEIRVKDKTRIQKQAEGISLEEMIKDLPSFCDKGSKKNSKGHLVSWNGYKLHIDTIDNGIPVSAILTSASVHDSQVAIPLAAMSSVRVVNCYDLMDAAYDVKEILDYSISLNHIPIVDENPRRDKELQLDLTAESKARHFLNWKPAESIRYNQRSSAERSNARLKDEFGARNVRVKGYSKVLCHLMIGVLVLSADQLLRLIP